MTYEQLQYKYRNYNKTKIHIEVLKESISGIEITGIPAMSYDFNINNNSYVSDITPKQAMEYAEKKDNIKKTIKVLENQIIILDLAKKILSCLENTIIEEILIKHRPYVNVCDQLHISECYAKKIKKRALKKMLEVFEDEMAAGINKMEV